jgi:hypothetical protein
VAANPGVSWIPENFALAEMTQVQLHVMLIDHVLQQRVDQDSCPGHLETFLHCREQRVLKILRAV